MTTLHVSRPPNPLGRAPAAALLAALALTGCGSSRSSSHAAAPASGPATTSATTPAPSTTTAGPAPPVAGLAAAEHPRTGEFPAPRGRTLQQLAGVAGAQVQLGAATATRPVAPTTPLVVFVSASTE